MVAAWVRVRSLIAILVVCTPLELAALSIPNCIRYNFSFPTVLEGKPLFDVILRMYGFADNEPSVPSPSAEGLSFKNVRNGYANAAAGEFSGATWNGLDQYAVYYIMTPMQQVLTEGGDEQITVNGLWPNIAYLSVQVKYGIDLTDSNNSFINIPASAFQTLSATGARAAPNPFVQGHPSVSAYKHQSFCISREGATTLSAAVDPVAKAELQTGVALASANTPCQDGNANLYRLSVDATILASADAATGDCASSYLFSPAHGFPLKFPSSGIENSIDLYNFSWGVIKIKVPSVFNPAVSKLFPGALSAENPNGYDLEYFSVSANIAGSLPDPNLPFTVNAVMMQEDGMITEEGLSYVLFAPMAFVPNATKANLTAPPRVFLPRLGVSAYVLAAPSYMFMFRYKNPSDSWAGSPSNVPCVATLQEINASRADCASLGQWAPQITRMEAVQSLEELAASVA